MHGKIGLAIAIKVSRSQHDPALDWVFENTGLKSSSSPGKQTGQANV
jgi:hypothetical protein